MNELARLAGLMGSLTDQDLAAIVRNVVHSAVQYQDRTGLNLIRQIEVHAGGKDG